MKGDKNCFNPKTPDFENQVRSSFARQAVMKLIGAELAKVAPGEVEIQLPFRNDLTQQHGFLHAGIITTIVDNACGYAALSLMPDNATVLTIEFKVNFLSPAKGELFLAKGKVVKPGHTITVCAGEVFSLEGEKQKLIATMTATMIMLQGRPGIPPG
ncbi:PaaI family thioesterase [Carboxydocella sp. JDF658]|uniref:PaaI family thioesterase n=1 Tax=Carboxydocella sp. JDF658 TaxID=1926600 RepID=UPI0009AE8705|nr:PaaI family thioesterase [Carboxydocella sp. JDF658]GAW31085.1 thioesterase [Carboxydocella sp. JDF658]